jgi:hypothetical protein
LLPTGNHVFQCLPEFFFGRFFCAKFSYPGLSGGFSPKAGGLLIKSWRAFPQKLAGFSLKAGGLFSEEAVSKER